MPNNFYFRCHVTPEMKRASELESQRRGPHFVPRIRVYANALAFGAIRGKGSGSMPVGSVIVKEKLFREPEGYAAMIKREDGYDPKNGNWEYVYATLGSEGKIERGRLENCIGCHATVARKDYLFRTYLDGPPEKKE